MNSHFQLHVITDGMKQEKELASIVTKTVLGGADYVQLRYKSAPALDLYQLGSLIQPLLAKYGAGLLINDRVDVALALQASGVHLAGKSLPVAIVREFSPNNLIGCSVHSVEEAITVEQQGANYVTFGHVFRTTSKPGLQPRGIESLQEVVNAVNIPVLAIGGIDTGNIDQVLQTGCAGIAVISAVMGHQDPERATRQLKEKMINSQYQPRVTLHGARK